MGDERIIFVGGCMRSGTTLVQRLLCAAEGASPLAAECQYLTALLELREGWAPRYDEFLKDYFADPAAFDGFSRKLVDEFIAAAFARFRPASTLVLKNPELSRHFPVLARWYPAARFVLVVRDPLDTIASIAKVAQRHHETGVASLIATYRHDMARMSALYKHYYEPVMRSGREFDDRLLVLRYEDLVAQARQCPRPGLEVHRAETWRCCPGQAARRGAGLLAGAQGQRLRGGISLPAVERTPLGRGDRALRGAPLAGAGQRNPPPLRRRCRELQVLATSVIGATVFAIIPEAK